MRGTTSVRRDAFVTVGGDLQPAQESRRRSGAGDEVLGNRTALRPPGDRRDPDGVARLTGRMGPVAVVVVGLVERRSP